MKYCIDLDWADTISSARFEAKNYRLETEVIDEEGEGGWPYIRFIGERNDLIRFIVCAFDKDADVDYDLYFREIAEYDDEATCICDHCGALISDDNAHFGNGAEAKLCDCCYNKLTEDEKDNFTYFGSLPKRFTK